MTSLSISHLTVNLGNRTIISDLSFDLAITLGDKYGVHYTVIIKEYEEWQVE
jgi:hypothetical protein